MSDTKEQPICSKCGTPLVPTKKKITFDGSVSLDGTSSFDGQSVCPKCHPELVEQ